MSHARGNDTRIVDAALPALQHVLDPGYLEELLGAPARIERVRYKPGDSIIAAVRTTSPAIDDGAERIVWVAGYSEKGADKLDKVRVRAERSTSRFLVRAVPGAPPGHFIGAGEPAIDRELYKTFRWWRRHHGSADTRASSIPDVGHTVVRYNPHRRIVLRVEGGYGAIAVKLIPPGCPHPSRMPELIERVAERVPVATFVATTAASVTHAARNGVTATMWWGEGDLSAPGGGATRRLDAARTAGRALARVHSTRWSDAAGFPAAVASQAHLLSRPLNAIAENKALLCTLLPNERRRVEELARQLAVQQAAVIEEQLRDGDECLGLVHGDFSADQVLLGAGTDIRLIDFDRARISFPAEDLGTFAAVELAASGERPLTDALLDGYRAEAPGDFTADAAVWQAYSLFTRAAEPFRRQCPGWPKRIPGLLTLAERSLR